MIKFFQKIRYNLMETGKTSKYFKYAIGEIILVVIGILIALQINNWNQELQNNKKEQKYYQKFLHDVLLDEKIIEAEVNATETRLQAANNVARLLLNDETDLSLISNQLQISIANSTMDFKPTTNTYDDVKFSGNLNLIRDDTLKFKLDRFYSKQNQIMKVINTNTELIAKRLMGEKDLIKTFAGTLFMEGIGDTTSMNTKRLRKYIQSTSESNYALLNHAVIFTMFFKRNLIHFDELLDNSSQMKIALKEKLQGYD